LKIFNPYPKNKKIPVAKSSRDFFYLGTRSLIKDVGFNFILFSALTKPLKAKRSLFWIKD